MQFEISQRIHTSASECQILDFLEARLRIVAQEVTRSDEGLIVRKIIKETVGTTDRGVISLRKKQDGYACVAAVNHRATVGLVITFFLLVFTWVFWVLPIIWVWYQKKNIRASVVDILARTRDEFENEPASTGTGASAVSRPEELKKEYVVQDEDVAVGLSSSKQVEFFHRSLNRKQIIIATVVLLAVFAGILAVAGMNSREESGKVAPIVDCQKVDCSGYQTGARGGPVVQDPGATGKATPLSPFRYSGRIPNHIQGFQLGMGVGEALARDPALEKYLHDGKPSPSDLDVTLVAKVHGFSTGLGFFGGNLLNIHSYIGSVSPSDAALFDRNILAQLGPPSGEVYVGLENKSWVWIDGDVRIRYEDRVLKSLGEGREVEIDVAIIPALLASEEKKNRGVNSDAVDGDWLLKSLRYQWAIDDEPVIRRPMPRGEDDVKLRMAPWQVRAALPGIDISSISDNEQRGTYQRNSSRVDVSFWDQQACAVCRETTSVSVEQFDNMRRRLMEELGTPAGGWKSRLTEVYDWEDDEVTVDYMWGPSMGEGGKPAVRACFRDKELQGQKDSQELLRQPPKYTSPETRSFF
ncbi:MAG TPA: hypothetical protein VEK84_10520 [Terriglobales bacterium]|nr:hypothetical protein [Terriglobales bacterium]